MTPGFQTRNPARLPALRGAGCGRRVAWLPVVLLLGACTHGAPLPDPAGSPTPDTPGAGAAAPPGQPPPQTGPDAPSRAELVALQQIAMSSVAPEQTASPALPEGFARRPDPTPAADSLRPVALAPVAPAPATPAALTDADCTAREEIPAVYEQVMGEVQVVQAEIAPDGTVLRPPVYREAPVPRMVRPRGQFTFDAVCGHQMTPEFIASLQRALAARGYFAGNVSGTLDAPTSAAIRRYQAERGLDSAQLSLESARTLGLVTVDLAEGPPG